LLAFVPVAVVIVVLTIIIISAYVTASSHLAPYRTTVTRPSDLSPVFEDVHFTGDDHLTLRGWYAPPENGAVIILLHGYYGDRSGMLFHARALTVAGYGVLLYDERASGESEGNRRTYGWQDVEDVGGALTFLHNRAEWIGLVGCSIGGQIGLRATAQYPEIQAVMADGPAMVSARDFWPPADAFDILSLIFNGFMLKFIELRSGASAPSPMIDTIGRIEPRPILLLAGAEGSELPRIRHYYEHAGANAQLWEVPGAHHCDGPQVVPDEYIERMVEFFDEARRPS
jgi:pimeloyl-ACP methyl ester carboxylesterase